MKKPDDDSLTPQRKHRKLLKDGSGSEVWPESVEKIFVAGLRHYWDSPWATHSRGRSRWRNQFLVDYLHKAGIDRSKKQVASHIQVLRNMWKGEPEFHLVAGGDELLLDDGPVKSEDPLIKLDVDDNDDGTPSTTTYSPPDYEFANLPPSPSYSSSYPPRISTVSPHFRSLSPTTHRPLHHPTKHSPPAIYNLDHIPFSHHHSPRRNIPAFFNDVPSNALSALCIWAEGMSPSNIQLDSPTHGPITLQLKLCLPPIDDIRSPPALHGFQGTVSFTAPWSSSAKCITKVFAGNACISEEIDILQLFPATSSPSEATVTAFLPESSLSRSRWLDASLHTNIIQEFCLDGETLAYAVYHLDRRNSGGVPSAEFLALQRDRSVDKTPLPFPSPSSYATNYGYNPAPLTCPRQADQSSISYSLSPRLQPAMATSMLL